MIVLSEVVEPEVVGLTADRWELILIVLCVLLFGLGLQLARSL